MSFQDALVNCVVHSTQLLEIHDEKWLVLAQHKWATLMWPVNAEEVSGERDVQLCSLSAESDGATWFFLTDLDSIKAIPYYITWTGHGIALKTTAHREHVVKNSLRKSSGFNFKQLMFIAQLIQVQRPLRNLSRTDLVKCLAEHFSGGDPLYVSGVLEQDQTKSSESGVEANSDLIDELLDTMDRDELRDFSDLNKSQKAKKSSELQKKWRKLFQDKLHDAKEAGFSKLLEIFFVIVCVKFKRGQLSFCRECVGFVIPHCSGKSCQGQGQGQGEEQGQGKA